MKVILLFFLIVLVKVELSFCQRRDGFCPRELSLIPPGRRCRRECDTNDDCRGKKKRCRCDGVCGMSCFNPLAPCVNLTNPANGSFEYTNGRRFWSSTATYKCDEGFALRGLSMRTCQSDRMWSGEEPFCSDLGECGQSLNAAGIQQQVSILTRVVGGSDAQEGAWPWQVGIFRERLDVFSTFQGGLFGGGSLINKHWILTAAHVIVALEATVNYLDTTILALGYTELPSRNVRASPSGKIYRPRFVIKHPRYEQASLFDYDFALIRVGRQTSIHNEIFRDFDETSEGEVQFTDYIRPVCIPCTGTCVTPDELIGSRGEQLLTGDETPEEACAIEGAWLSGRNDPRTEVETIVTGFGSTRQRDFAAPARPGTSNKLLQASLTIDDDKDCQEAIRRVNQFQQQRFGSLFVYIPFTQQMICARNNTPHLDVDACQGDSGGPLIREVKTKSNRTCWVQVGVVSFGFGCAWEQNGYSYPGFYSDVSSASSWINSCKTRLTDAVRSDNLTCELDVTCTVLPIAEGIDAQTESFPLLQEGFEVNAYSLLLFTCIDNSLSIVGHDVVTCFPNGSFSSPYPTQCERRCHLTDVSEDVEIRTSDGVIPNVNANFRVGEEIVFSCSNPNHILLGQRMVQCREDGSWNGQFPTECRERLSECYGRGDPHYLSFDGKRFTFQGNCSYVFVRNSNRLNSMPAFTVEVDNENLDGNVLVSRLRKVYVRIAGTNIELLKGRLVKINEVAVNLPYESADGLFRISFSGRFVVIKTTFNMEVTYDGSYYISVGLSSNHFETVEGLCGNFNGDEDDDFRLAGSSTITTIPTVFGNTFQTDTKKNCDAFVAPQITPCSAANRRRYEASCSVLNERLGCFRDCLVDSQPYFEDCVFDACAFGDSRASLEANVGAYVKACHDRGDRVCSSWREDHGIPLNCPVNSTYSICASRCPRTCTSSDNLVCSPLCIEGCECNAGHVLSGDRCVLPEKCGCEYKGQYYQARQRFYDDDTCTSFCTCSDGLVTCRANPCRNGERCGRNEQGRRDCIAIGNATCLIWGDPHYQTFDGSEVYDFQGACLSYILAETIIISPSSARWFSIRAANEFSKENNRGSTRIQSIGVSFRTAIFVSLYTNGTILYRGEPIQGYDRGFLKVQPSGRSIRLSTTHGLEILVSNTGVRITLPSSYANRVRGICGNYNGDDTDELLTADGEEAESFAEVANSYQVAECDDPTTPPFVCPARATSIWDGRDGCGVLAAARGPFSSCHDTVDPLPFFERCVYDLCFNGNISALGDGLQTYARECQLRGKGLCVWRRATGTEIACPPNSRYDGCATACPNTCQFPFASTSCPIKELVEDCVCNVGFIRDGERCVRQSDCGTTENGVYRSKVISVDLIAPATSRFNFTFESTMFVLSSFPDPETVLPRFHKYIYDNGFLSINDGGLDMYDGGNQIQLYKNGFLALDVLYNETYRFEDYAVVSDSSHPFVSLLYIFNQNQERANYTLRVFGNAGADGAGNITLYEGTIRQNNFVCEYYVFQIGATQDPSICEVYALFYSEEEWGSVRPESFIMSRISDNTDRLDNQAEAFGRMKNVMMAYTLLSRLNGALITEPEVRRVLSWAIVAMSVDDVNECEENNGGCQDTCTNVLGSFFCTCTEEGFVLDLDRRACVEILSQKYLMRAAMVEPELPVIIPFWYDYIFDGANENPDFADTAIGSFISDGGNDMFDTGNLIRIYEGSTAPDNSLHYGTSQKLPGYEYTLSGAGPHPFMAFIWIENANNEQKTYSIQVDGNYGADGDGSTEINRGSVIISGGQIDYRAFQVYSANPDPSICEVYFVVIRSVWSSTRPQSMTESFTNNTDIGSNRVQISGRPRNILFSYALLSKQNGQQVLVNDIVRFLERVGAYIATGSQTPPLERDENNAL